MKLSASKDLKTAFIIRLPEEVRSVIEDSRSLKGTSIKLSLQDKSFYRKRYHLQVESEKQTVLCYREVNQDLLNQEGLVKQKINVKAIADNLNTQKLKMKTEEAEKSRHLKQNELPFKSIKDISEAKKAKDLSDNDVVMIENKEEEFDFSKYPAFLPVVNALAVHSLSISSLTKITGKSIAEINTILQKISTRDAVNSTYTLKHEFFPFVSTESIPFSDLQLLKKNIKLASERLSLVDNAALKQKLEEIENLLEHNKEIEVSLGKSRNKEELKLLKDQYEKLKHEYYQNASKYANLKIELNRLDPYDTRYPGFYHSFVSIKPVLKNLIEELKMINDKVNEALNLLEPK
ncbi:hypothetical protein O9G_000798 [Rozella allomycis CSF55]|uniref:Uncharacterized protein n=1 Tax=Rozella allomycis (strain CSF55) TaxID=988480 RepID=A0A075AR60_ROZAC|nr:hypothetical protein O9G_000798 [Rozella allomycis CSF55]|eukprot:EPZ32723.1 hypothetical protein O9G_000798 [Rozella allomycis CSF55]